MKKTIAGFILLILALTKQQLGKCGMGILPMVLAYPRAGRPCHERHPLASSHFQLVPLPGKGPITAAFLSIAGAQETDRHSVEAAFLKRARDNVERYRKGDATLKFDAAPGVNLRGARVEVQQASHHFLFGNVIRYRHFHEPGFQERFREMFNFATLLEFNWAQYEPLEGQTRRAQRDEIARWCRKNGITTNGHMLVWTRKSGVPDWLAPYSATKRYELLKARVKDVVKVHASTIDSWVVVNEPIMCRVWGDTTEPENRQEKLDRIVPYVHDAFVWSHRANPTATLILNEYRLIAPEANRRRFIGLVRMLQEQNTPISVLGIQGHEPEKGRYWYSPQQLWETYDELGALGCPLYITEFLPPSSGKPISGGWRKGLWNEQTQAEFGEHFYRLSFGHPAVSCIVWFGLSDADVVYPGGGLLDKNYRPKKAWTVLKRLIHEEWTTRASGGLTADGAFRFRGFYGQYELRLRTADGKEFSFRIHVQKDQANRWTFPLPAP